MPLYIMLTAISSFLMAVTTPSKANPQTFDTKALATCMAFVSQEADYREIPDEEIQHYSPFYDEVMQICGKQIAPLWSEAHERARVELGLPEQRSRPMTPDEARRSMNEMNVAERQLRAVVAEHWPDAQTLRHQPLDISPSAMTTYMQGWLFSEHRAERLISSAEKSVRCVGATIHTNDDIKALLSEETEGNFAASAHKCKFDDAVEAISASLRQRFATADPTVAHAVADNFLRQIVFWSLTGQH
jgi:hypothetical protein